MEVRGSICRGLHIDVLLHDLLVVTPHRGGRIVTDEFPSLPSIGLDRGDCEKLRLGLFKNYFLIPPFLKNITEGYRMSVKNMVKLWF